MSSFELIGGLIRTGTRPAEPPADLLRAVARRTRIVNLPNRIIGLCRMPNGKTLCASTPLQPIRQRLASQVVARYQNQPGLGWGSIKKGIGKAARKVGAAKVVRILGKGSVKLKLRPFLGEIGDTYTEMSKKGASAMFGKTGERIVAMQHKLARKLVALADKESGLRAAADAAHPKVHATIDAAAEGDPKARAVIRGVHDAARTDPRAAKALAQMRIVNRVRVADAARTMMAVQEAAAAKMPPEKAARVTARAAQMLVPPTAAMSALEPDANRRAWIFQLCGRVQQAPAIAMACPPSGAAAGFWGTGRMTPPSGASWWDRLNRAYLLGADSLHYATGLKR